MGQTLPKPALRPFLAADIPILAAIFIAAIEELTADDYSEAQREAWASAADDEEQFGKRLASELTLVATLMAQIAPERLAFGISTDAEDGDALIFLILFARTARASTWF